jgi:hypothetical protein
MMIPSRAQNKKIEELIRQEAASIINARRSRDGHLNAGRIAEARLINEESPDEMRVDWSIMKDQIRDQEWIDIVTNLVDQVRTQVIKVAAKTLNSHGMTSTKTDTKTLHNDLLDYDSDAMYEFEMTLTNDILDSIKLYAESLGDSIVLMSKGGPEFGTEFSDKYGMGGSKR